MSLSIHLNGIEDTNDVKDEISWWGGRLKEAFEQLEVGDVIEKGREDRRLEVELHGSEMHFNVVVVEGRIAKDNLPNRQELEEPAYAPSAP